MRRNLEMTQGLVFSQRVLLALIGKGLSRQKAYELVQQNAMMAWTQKIPLLGLLKKDKEVSNKLSAKELEEIFDYTFFLKHIDTIFKRLHFVKKTKKTKNESLAPQAL
jgi:adenylosuccinate lyase